MRFEYYCVVNIQIHMNKNLKKKHKIHDCFIFAGVDIEFRLDFVGRQ